MSSPFKEIEQFLYANEHISETVQYQKALGKKIVGVLPIYAPVELVHAAGLFPVGCWGGQIPIQKAREYLPPFGCSILQSITEMAANGTYHCLDALLISTPCDTLRCSGQNLKSALPTARPIFCIAPTNSKAECAVTYYVSELKRTGAELEDLSGRPLTAEAINASIALYNENRQALCQCAALMAERPGLCSAVERHAVMRSRPYMDIEEHTALVKSLNLALASTPAPSFQGKKIFLAGITAEPNWLLEILDDLGLAVVGDELAQEWRQIATPVPDGFDPWERLARQHQNRTACSLILDGKRSRTHSIAERASALQADGVLYCQMKFCDPEEQDYPSVKNALSHQGIPVLNLEIDQNSNFAEPCRTRLQAFLDVLER